MLKTPVIHTLLEGFFHAICQSISTILKQLLLLLASLLGLEQAVVKQTSATVLVQLFQNRYYMILLSVTAFVVSNFESRFN